MPLDDSATPDNGKPQPQSRTVVITPPKFESAAIHIRGISPYMQHNFAQKAIAQIEATQREGSRSRKGRKRDARDFEADYEAAKHISEDGWCGVPAPAFRNALISACRLAGFAMTRAKLSIFVEADGWDRDGRTPLIRINGNPEPPGEPQPVRNESGVVDLRMRPVWRRWEVVLRLRWDADQFSAADILNLVARAGLQVGVGEGRPDSPNSNGLGNGCWEVMP
jgi:hypothetical protein